MFGSKFVAIIPMKGHSARLSGKNVKNLNGKPLFYWIISSLYRSKFVSDVFVDTDSPVIEKLCRQYFPKIKVVKRPKSLRGDLVSVNDIIAYDLGQIKGEFFIQTHSTNPLLKTSTIDSAIKRFLTAKGKDSLFSVNEFKSRFFDYKMKPINHNLKKLVRTQDLKPVYEDNSNFYIFTRKSFVKTGARIGKRPVAFVVKKAESLDIDTSDDFYVAEAILRFNPKPS